MGKYTVIVSRRADEMLIRHARFLAQVRKAAALRMIDSFEEVLDTLEENPYLYPVEEELLGSGENRQKAPGRNSQSEPDKSSQRQPDGNSQRSGR